MGCFVLSLRCNQTDRPTDRQTDRPRSLLVFSSRPPISEDPNAIVIPREHTAEIAQLLAATASERTLRVLSWNIDGLDEVGGGGERGDAGRGKKISFFIENSRSRMK